MQKYLRKTKSLFNKVMIKDLGFVIFYVRRKWVELEKRSNREHLFSA